MNALRTTIYELKDGQWNVKIAMITKDGKEIRKNVNKIDTISREEVRKKLGSVCQYCRFYQCDFLDRQKLICVGVFNCEKFQKDCSENCKLRIDKKGCSDFKLLLQKQCDLDCKNCYEFKLEVCRGVKK